MGLIIRAFSNIRLIQPVPRNASGCFDVEERGELLQNRAEDLPVRA